MKYLVPIAMFFILLVQLDSFFGFGWFRFHNRFLILICGTIFQFPLPKQNRIGRPTSTGRSMCFCRKITAPRVKILQRCRTEGRFLKPGLCSML